MIFIKFMKILASRIAPDVMQRSGLSHLGLYCLPMSHKKDTRLKLTWNNFQSCSVLTSSKGSLKCLAQGHYMTEIGIDPILLAPDTHTLPLHHASLSLAKHY